MHAHALKYHAYTCADQSINFRSFNFLYKRNENLYQMKISCYMVVDVPPDYPGPGLTGTVINWHLIVL